MAAVRHPLLRKLLSFGAGAGIVVDDYGLQVLLATVRPGGVKLRGSLRIEDFRQRPAAEWGEEYARFLARNGQKHLSAILVLPRHQVTTRTLQLAGVSDEDAPAAVGFQLDSLHPYEEADVYVDWQRIGRTAHFVVAVALREVVDGYAALFAEAGIALAGITYSGGAVHPAIRVLGEPPADGFLAFRDGAASAALPVEIYGENGSGVPLSAELDLPVNRAAGLARAELRLDAAVEPVELIDLLAGFEATDEQENLAPAARARLAVPYAAALVSACGHLGRPLNLLPSEQRSVRSRAVYLPTVLLGVVLLCLSAALLLQPAWIENSYTQRLQAEIDKLEPVLKRSEGADRRSAELMRRLQVLDQFKRSSRQDLDLLLALTRMIEPPASLQNLTLTRSAVTMSGVVGQADALLKRLEESPQFRNVDFTAPLMRGPANDTEIFRIRAEREAGR